MDREKIVKLIDWLKDNVSLGGGEGGVKIIFDELDAEDFENAGFGGEIIELTLYSSWWNDMLSDLIETPDFAEPDDSPVIVLGYACDLIQEYVSKRLLT